MISLVRQRRNSGSHDIAPAAIHQICRCCYLFGMVLGGFFIGIGPVTLLVTNVRAVGGDTDLWHPNVRYYGRIIGGVTWAAGVILLFFCYQFYGRTENRLMTIMTRYRRHRRQTKPPDIHEQPHDGAMGDAVQLEDVPLNVTVSDIPLVGVSSDQSIASHHMTIESWFSRKLHSKQAKIPHEDPLPRLHQNNFCANNNTETCSTFVNPHYVRVDNPDYVELKDIGTDWQKSYSTYPEMESCAIQEFVRNNLESCNTKFTQTEESDTILHQHFSPPKVFISAPGEDKSQQTSPDMVTGCSVKAPQIHGFSPGGDVESQGDTGARVKTTANILDEETESDDIPSEAILRAIASIDKMTEELDEYFYDDVVPLDYDESFEEARDDIAEYQTEDEIQKTLDFLNMKNEEFDRNLHDDVEQLPLIHYDECIDAAEDDALQGEDPGDFVDPFQYAMSPVEVYPVETEQITFAKAKSSKKSAPATDVTLSEEFNAFEVHPHGEGAAGDTHWQGRRNHSPRGTVFPEGGHMSDAAALGDYHKDQIENATLEESVKEDMLNPRGTAFTPDFLISACDDILDSSFKRRRSEQPAFSTPNTVDISSPDPGHNDTSSSTCFLEGACASDGSVLLPSGMGTVHTLSESYVSTPVAKPAETVSLESPEPAMSRELNSSCNSNSPEKDFPLQLASANIDLLSASANTNTITNNNTNANNINRNNNVPVGSKSDGNLASPPPSSDVPAVSSYSSTSFHSVTTDGTMYSTQDTLSFDTVVDSDDEYQNDLQFTPEFGSAVENVPDDAELTDTTTL